MKRLLILLALILGAASSALAQKAELTVTPSLVIGGAAAQGKLALTGSVAPSGGVVVTLTSSAPTIASVPASVTLPAGQAAVTFAIATTATTSPVSVTIKASAGATTVSAAFTVTPAAAPVPTPEPPPTPTPPPDPDDVTKFPYFATLRAHPNVVWAHGLRNQTELLQYRAGGGKPAACNYVYATDPDARKQNAAKCVIPAGVPSLQNQVWIPSSTQDGHEYLYIWEAWFGKEFAFTSTKVSNFKTFQFRWARCAPPCKPAIAFEVQNNWQGGIVGQKTPNLEAQREAGLLHVRYYATATTPAGPGVLIQPYLQPQLAQFVIKAETWTRYFVLFKQKVNGDAWTRASLWVADETRDPVLIYDNVPITIFMPGSGIADFDLEFNTSTDLAPAFPRTAYVRNVAMLKDVPNPLSLLYKPEK